MTTAKFPTEQAKQFLVQSLSRRLDQNISSAAEAIIDEHLDPQNFPMPKQINRDGLLQSLQSRNYNHHHLRTFMKFEDSLSIQGICRVMVRTHLNRSGIGFVSRGETDKTLARRVVGLFDADFDPKNLVDWKQLTEAWVDFAHATTKRKERTFDGCAVFNTVDIESLEHLSHNVPKTRKGALSIEGVHNNWARLVWGVHTGIQYLQNAYKLDTDAIWSKIERSSHTAKEVQQLVSEAKQSVSDFGQALAGSFFADLGGASFVKADIHVKNSVAAFLDKPQVSDDEAIDLIQRSASRTITPRGIDKIMYLAGSGNFYLFGIRFKMQQAKFKKEFLDHLRKLGGHS